MIDWSQRVLFLDGEAIIIDKPAGLAVHPGPATPRSLEDELGALRFGFARKPMPVHRLDRDTSGCLLIARNPKALKRFSQAFADGAVAKLYAAVLEGEVAGDEGVIDLPLDKVSSREAGWRMVASAGGRPARTGWQVVARAGGRTLVALRPQTGRTHQIRVHAATGLGAPVVGDPVYGTARAAMLLHAAALTVPRAGKPPVSARAPLPPSFGAFAACWPVDEA